MAPQDGGEGGGGQGNVLQLPIANFQLLRALESSAA